MGAALTPSSCPPPLLPTGKGNLGTGSGHGVPTGGTAVPKGKEQELGRTGLSHQGEPGAAVQHLQHSPGPSSPKNPQIPALVPSGVPLARGSPA